MKGLLDCYATLPRKLPGDGKVIVHNRVWAQWEDQLPGLRGFRAWTAPKQGLKRMPNLQPCDCGWSGLPHYRTDPEEGGYGKPPNVKGKRMPSAK